MNFFRRIPEPAISRRGLMTGAGLFWIVGGTVLIWRAVHLPAFDVEQDWLLFLLALVVGVLKTVLVFSRVVKRNLARIEELAPNKSKICLFAFQSLQSYFLVLIMITLGFLLRMTSLNDTWLAAIYLAIGSALILSSSLFFRALPRN